MALREIDENEYAELRRVADVAATIGKHPRARTLLQEAVALAVPDQVGPEIRIRNEINERVGGIEKTINDFIAEQKKDREEREATEQRRQLEARWSTSQAVARDAGYVGEGLTKLEEFMERNGIADHELAIPAFERLNPPPEPVSTGSQHFNLFGMQQTDSEQEGDALQKFMASGGQDDEAFLSAVLPIARKETWGR